MSNMLLVYLITITGLLTAVSSLYVADKWPYLTYALVLLVLLFFIWSYWLLLVDRRKNRISRGKFTGHLILTFFALAIAVSFFTTAIGIIFSR